MQQLIEGFINTKNIAIVGVSKNAHKFGNSAYKELKKRGYNVYAIHPSEKELNGDVCYPDLSSIKDKVDAVFVSVSSNKVSEILKEAKANNLNKIWLQQGSETPEIIREAGELGLEAVSKKCILMYAPPVNSIHKFHRAINQFFGKL